MQKVFISSYKLIISYDGTDYGGWQRQKERSDSVVCAMQHAYQKVFNAPVFLLGASRTDVGVHAIGQVALGKMTLSVAPEKILYAWNNALPDTIRICSLERVEESFHPYRAHTIKTYWYHFFIKQPTPFASRYGWHITAPVDMEKLRQCLNIFIGTHNFSSFCTGAKKSTLNTNHIRTIFDITLEYMVYLDCYRIAIKGNGFLRHMIRRIVGASLSAATNKEISMDYVKKVFEKKDANNPLITAPARGLVLYTIEYIKQ
jgi:tRNA pseudouridine38-40 synthase